jgi:trans-aconitate methyltransferase
MLGALVPEHLGEFLRGRSPRPKTCVEVGTMCGELLYRVAVQFPDIHFVGVDRNPVIKRLNDQGYHLPNLEFRADDIINVLEDPKLDFAGAVLFHTRTSPFLLPDFMRKLYGRCREVGFGAITMLEMYSVSIEHKRFHRFADMPQISEIRGGGLMTHNYPKILNEAGFPKVEWQFVNANTIFSGSDSSVFLAGTA